MVRFAARRLAGMVFVLFAVSIITFAIFYEIPGGDPVVRIAGRSSNAVTRAQVRSDFGFDDPFYTQYLRLMQKTVNGDLESYATRVNVRSELVRGIPATASLVLGAAVIWLLFGILLGTAAAIHAGRAADRVVALLAVAFISVPTFWLGAMLLYYLTFKVSLFPPGGYVPLTEDPGGWLSHMILPWVTLSVVFIGLYSRVLRGSMLDTLHEDYVRTARAKGVPEHRIILRHAMRNALVPIVALFALDFGAAIGGGAILVESVFDLQGVGQYVADSIGNLDLPPIMGVTLYGTFFIVLLSALGDVAHTWLDPRIRPEE